MEIFQLTLFFMLAFFLVVAIQVTRNRRSTIWVSYEGQEYWLLCLTLLPCEKLRVIAYLEQPGFTFGPYIWVYVITNESGEVISLVEESDDF